MRTIDSAIIVGEVDARLFPELDFESPGFCAECHKRIHFREPWSTCSICGKPICEVCQRPHTPRCMALGWGLARVNPETGELEQVERPPEYAIGD